MKIDLTQFNPAPATWMHIDLNSCFATVEQQANPFLRGKPIVVAAYTTDYSAILAPSVEAKKIGIKMGMRVRDAKQIYKDVIVLAPDPSKYRFVNKELLKLCERFTPNVAVRSIDEMVLDFSMMPNVASIFEIGREIKVAIKREIGEWLTVSVGISTNPYLAKLAACLFKPDGLHEIKSSNILATLSKMQLTDFPYIKEANQARLNRMGIFTPLDFYWASKQKLKSAFESVVGDYWYLRLHGFKVDAVEWGQKTIGHSYHLHKFTKDKELLKKLMCKLIEKTGRRLRKHGLTARGLQVTCVYDNWSHGHNRRTYAQPLYDSRDLFLTACKLLDEMKLEAVRIFAVHTFLLEKSLFSQLTLFNDEEKKRSLVAAMDKINGTWGEFTVTPALMMGMENTILDRVAFGKSGALG